MVVRKGPSTHTRTLHTVTHRCYTVLVLGYKPTNKDNAIVGKGEFNNVT